MINLTVLQQVNALVKHAHRNDLIISHFEVTKGRYMGNFTSKDGEVVFAYLHSETNCYITMRSIVPDERHVIEGNNHYF